MWLPARVFPDAKNKNHPAIQSFTHESHASVLFKGIDALKR
jgi:hypothetical protein